MEGRGVGGYIGSSKIISCHARRGALGREEKTPARFQIIRGRERRREEPRTIA